MFSELEKESAVILLKNFSILICEEKAHYLYRTHERADSSYILLFGRVNLYGKGLGLFQVCRIGTTCGEEGILETNAKRLENAKALKGTVLLNLS